MDVHHKIALNYVFTPYVPRCEYIFSLNIYMYISIMKHLYKLNS